MRGADLTAVIAWLEAGCDPAEAVKELRSHQDALSSQSLSLSEAREEIERLRKSERKAVDDLCRWRAAFQSFTPGGSEFFDPKAVREWAEGLKTQVFEANKRAVLAERKALENSKAPLADAHINPPLSDLSSLRKGAEVMREAIKAVTDSTGAYLPPDGISKDELISRVLAATDNPEINAVMMGGRNGHP